MPELPEEKRQRFQKEFDLSDYDASQLISDRNTTDYFEAALEAIDNNEPKLVANWVLTDLAAALNRAELPIAESKVKPTQLAQLIRRISDETISNNMARKVFAAMWDGEENGDPDRIIEKRGYKQISDTGAIKSMVEQAIANNPKIVEQYQAGRDRAFNS